MAHTGRPARVRLAALTLLAGVGAAVAAAATVGRPYLAEYLPGFGTAARPDLILHTAKPEYLAVSVVERGTLESAENKEVICKVKAGSKGTYSSTIRWVIDDGTVVGKGQLLMELDDSALQDQHQSQSILVEKAKSEWITADENYVITAKQNESDVATAVAALRVAELDVEKFLGLRAEPALEPAGAVAGAFFSLAEKGEYRQRLDDVSGRLKLAESDLEAYRDRAAWASRSVRLQYLTPSQAKVEQSKLASALDNLEKLQKEKYILETFLRQRELTDLLSKLEVADLGLDRSKRQAQAKLTQAESVKRTTYSVYQRELDKLRDIDDQIRECKLYAPQDGMVVYFKEPSGRFGNTTEGMIQQGAQVKEGQKLLRIPDLRRMQVNTKVHEAMVSRIRGDDRQSTGHFETMRAGLLALPSAFARLVNHEEHIQAQLRESTRDKEYYLASQGQKALVRVDAFPDRVLQAHVRQVAAVASQTDFFSSDVKVYQTLVVIDESLDGLKPDMSAEVTIQVDPAAEPVLAVPLQAVVGGAEGGGKRAVYVAGAAGPEKRDVVLGAFNEKLVEVREGLKEGEQVVLNPKVIVGDKARTRDEAEAPSRRPGMGGAGEKGGKMKGKGGPPGGAGGAPAGVGGGPKGGPAAAG